MNLIKELKLTYEDLRRNKYREAFSSRHQEIDTHSVLEKSVEEGHDYEFTEKTIPYKNKLYDRIFVWNEQDKKKCVFFAKNIYGFIDTGASINLIDPSLVDALNFKIDRSDFMRIGGIHGSSSEENYRIPLKCNYRGHISKENFYHFPNLKERTHCLVMIGKEITENIERRDSKWSYKIDDRLQLEPSEATKNFIYLKKVEMLLKEMPETFVLPLEEFLDDFVSQPDFHWLAQKYNITLEKVVKVLRYTRGFKDIDDYSNYLLKSLALENADWMPKTTSKILGSFLLDKENLPAFRQSIRDISYDSMKKLKNFALMFGDNLVVDKVEKKEVSHFFDVWSADFVSHYTLGWGKLRKELLEEEDCLVKMLERRGFKASYFFTSRHPSFLNIIINKSEREEFYYLYGHLLVSIRNESLVAVTSNREGNGIGHLYLFSTKAKSSIIERDKKELRKCISQFFREETLDYIYSFFRKV